MKKICKICGKKRLIAKGFICKQCKIEKKPSYWKKKAWNACSMYNRQKDADPFTGKVKCITCPVILHWKQMQAGHFQAGRGNAILFYDKGIHAQCYACNVGRKGEQYLYGLYIEKRYGKEEVEKQQEMKNKIIQYTIFDFKKIEDKYKHLTKKSISASIDNVD